MSIRNILFTALLAIVCINVLRAQDASAPTATLLGLTEQQQIYLLIAERVLKYIGEIYSSIKAGGGLKRIIMSVWFGEQTPKVILEDYKKELETTPVLPKKDTP